MPRIGNVEVPDEVIEILSQGAAPARPGIGDVLSAATQGAIGQVRYGLPYQIEKLAGTASVEDEAYYRQGLADTAAAAARAAPASLSDLTSGRTGIARFVGENLVASIPYMVGGAVGAIGGGLAGSVIAPGAGTAAGAIAGGIAGGIPQFSASNVARAVEEQGGLSEAAAQRALAIAPAQAAADVAVARFLPGAGKVLGDLASTQAGGFLRRTAASVAKAGATEAVTEAAQQLGERYAAGIPVGDADAAGEYVNAAVTAFAVGGVLGAGGGFRRMNAHAKPADAVTNADLTEAIDGILDGSARRFPALPAPADFIARPDGVTEVNPSGTSQLLLPPPERFAQPEVYVDSAGRAAMAPPEGVDPVVLANMPRESGPTDAELLARIAQATQPEPIAAPNVLAQPAPSVPEVSTSVAALTGIPVGQTPAVDIPPVARPFRDADLADLNKARKAKNADPAIVASIDEELAARRAEDPFAGIRMNQDIVKLRDASPEDRIAGVVKLLEDGDSRAGTLQLAERLGIDLNAPGVPLEAEVETRRDAGAQIEEIQKDVPAQPVRNIVGGEAGPAQSSPTTLSGADTGASGKRAPVATSSQPPVAPSQPQVDPSFGAQWETLKREAGIQRLRSGKDVLGGEVPANLQQAQAQVMRGLANVDAFAAPETDQVEKLARQMGLVTNDDAMDITPLGRQAYLSTPEGFEETVAAARGQGYEGAQASIFDRGVRAQISGEATPTFSSFEDMAAFQAGKIWAQDFVENAETRTAAQTEAIRGRQAARATGTVVDRRSDTGRVQLTPEQIQQRSANTLLDLADLRTVSDTDVATLRRLVREGATPFEVGQALEQVQGGKTLFRQPEVRPEAFTPATVSRGQPIFKEMYDPTEGGPTRAEKRVESEAAVRAYELRNLIEFAKAEGGITEVRAAKLHDLLDEGKTDQVKRLLKDFDPDAKPRKSKLPTPPETVFERSEAYPYLGGPDAAFEAAIDGKDFDGVLEHMIAAAPSKYHREIMRQVKAAAGKLRKAGVEIGLQVVRPGDTAPTRLNNPNVRAVLVSETNPPRATVYLKSSAMRGGLNYQLAAHEMLHAVTDRLIDFGSRVDQRSTQIGKDVKDLIDLGSAVVEHFNARAAAGNLSEFEQAYYQRSTNALANAHEILAWGLTNPDMQRYLQSIEYKPRQSVFSKLVDLLRKLLGLEGKYETALTELLRVSERILRPGQADLHSVFARNNPDGFDAAPLTSEAREGAAENGTAQARSDAAQRASQAASQALETASEKLGDLGRASRRGILALISRNHLDREYGARVPGLLENSRAHEMLAAVRNKFELIGANALQNLEKLQNSASKQDREDARRINNLMEGAQYGLDGAKAWEDHTHLHGELNADDLKARHVQMQEDWKTLVRHKTSGAFGEAQAANVAQNLAHMVTQLYNRTALDPEYARSVPGGAVNPAEAFIDTAGINTGFDAQTHWYKELFARLSAVESYIKAQRGAIATLSPKDQADLRTRLNPLEGLVAEIHRNLAVMAERPYFHLPRFGEYFAAFTVKRANGVVDKAALKLVAQRLAEAGFDDVQLSTDNTNPRVMLRTDNWSQARALGDLALQLQKEGHLDKDVPVLAAPRSRDNNFGMGDRVPDYITKALEGIDTDPVFQPDASLSKDERAALEAQKEAAKRAMMDGWLDAQPSNSLSRVLAKRRQVQGASNDMIRGYAHRQHVGAAGVAAQMLRPDFAAAARQMRSAVEESAEVESAMDPVETRDVVSEVLKREASNPINPFADTFDKLRAAAHSYFIGLNLSSSAINLTALGTTVLPELAKRNGYGKSFHAMRRAEGHARAILVAALKDARQRGLQHAADLSLTENVLKAAKIPEPVREFVRQMEARGQLDLGTMSRVLGQFSEGRGTTKLDTYMRYSSAFNIYSETYARLIAAIAANDMHAQSGSAAARDYASQVVKDSLFEFQPRNVARALGKQGVLGPVTPIITQFMQWNLQVLEKLYTEFRAATKGDTDATRWLAGHMVAMTALTGTLGLPFATVFAALIEKIFGDEDDPFDATAAWRNFLADMLGQDVGEVVARGLPRTLGFDISSRAGEANILPFSELLADKRGWREAMQSSAGRGLGAAPSMVVNVLEGGEKFMSGDILGGLKAALPTYLKNPVEVYRMTDEGYVDTRGNKLPMSPAASAYMWQLLGFQPAAKAEYGEARADQAARRGEIARRAGELRQGIARALEQGDRDAARELIAEAMEFDTATGSGVVDSLATSLQRRAQARATSSALQAPLGVSMRDIAGQQLTGYANVNYGQ